MASIDLIFRDYAIEFFGKEAVEKCFPDGVIEKARCYAFSEIAEITKRHGKQKHGAVKELFLNYLFENYV